MRVTRVGDLRDRDARLVGQHDLVDVDGIARCVLADLGRRYRHCGCGIRKPGPVERPESALSSWPVTTGIATSATQAENFSAKLQLKMGLPMKVTVSPSALIDVELNRIVDAAGREVLAGGLREGHAELGQIGTAGCGVGGGRLARVGCRGWRGGLRRSGLGSGVGGSSSGGSIASGFGSGLADPALRLGRASVQARAVRCVRLRFRLRRRRFGRLRDFGLGLRFGGTGLAVPSPVSGFGSGGGSLRRFRRLGLWPWARPFSAATFATAGLALGTGIAVLAVPGLAAWYRRPSVRRLLGFGFLIFEPLAGWRPGHMLSISKKQYFLLAASAG